jgi:beta-phosphoglucomutase-like phosphatase (HAD superfamily)
MLAPVAVSDPSFTAVLFGLSGCLVDFGAQAAALRSKESQQIVSAEVAAQAADYACPTPGALAVLKSLRHQGVPYAWIEEFPTAIAQALAKPLSGLIQAGSTSGNHWPAPDACWQALMTLQVSQLDGCVLVSGDPRLITSGLNAGLWTIGLASCGPLCGVSPAKWESLNDAEREQLRTRATLKLYEIGAHSVIDHLGELESCLADIALRRLKAEKP